VIPQGVDPRLLEALDRATSLELFQLRAVNARLLADPRRIVAIRKALHLGQTVRFMDWRDGHTRSGKVVAQEDVQLVIDEDGSRREWKLPCAAIEPLPATSRTPQPPEPQPPRPTRSDFRCGEKVASDDRDLQTQVGTLVRINERSATIDTGDGTKWRVGFALLRHVLDVWSGERVKRASRRRLLRARSLENGFCHVVQVGGGAA
jgi:hypothetical protein